MRTLSEITSAVRLKEPVTEEELKRAVVAYDVLLHVLNLPEDPERLLAFFQAGSSDPKEWAGPSNDYDDPETVKWYKAMHSAGRVQPPDPVICELCTVPVPPGCSGEFCEDSACVGFHNE